MVFGNLDILQPGSGEMLNIGVITYPSEPFTVWQEEVLQILCNDRSSCLIWLTQQSFTDSH